MTIQGAKTVLGRLRLVQGQALDHLGQAHFSIVIGKRAIEWVMAEIGTDEGILGNDFAMTHKVIVRLHEGVNATPPGWGLS